MEYQAIHMLSGCIVTSFGCCGDKRVTAVIEAYIEGSSRFNMTGDAGNPVWNAIRQDQAYN
jgi:hypothetical protein